MWGGGVSVCSGGCQCVGELGGDGGGGCQWVGEMGMPAG